MRLLGEGALVSVLQCLTLHGSLLLSRICAAAKDEILFCSGFPQRLGDGPRTCLMKLTETGMAELYIEQIRQRFLPWTCWL